MPNISLHRCCTIILLRNCVPNLQNIYLQRCSSLIEILKSVQKLKWSICTDVLLSMYFLTVSHTYKLSTYTMSYSHCTYLPCHNPACYLLVQISFYKSKMCSLPENDLTVKILILIALLNRVPYLQIICRYICPTLIVLLKKVRNMHISTCTDALL